MKFHHIGVACADIEEAIDNFLILHDDVTKSEVVYDELQKAFLVMLTLQDGTNVELISGPVVEKLVKKGISYYHLCYETNDLEATIKDFVKKGAMIVSPPKPAILFNNRKVAFLHLSYGLVELLSSY